MTWPSTRQSPQVHQSAQLLQWGGVRERSVCTVVTPLHLRAKEGMWSWGQKAAPLSSGQSEVDRFSQAGVGTNLTGCDIQLDY